MPVKIRVRDFQSLEDVTLEVQGLTVVTGSNNTGKSAIVRATRGAFQNLKGTSFIRHGAPRSIVEIDLGDGHSLRWEKGRGKGDKPTFVIDGGAPIHPGQGVPDEVRGLGVRPIVAGGREIWPQIAPQFTGQVFLLDQPGSVMAEAVADVERVSQLNEALRMASSDKRSIGGELATRRDDATRFADELRFFDGLDDAFSTLTQIEASLALVQRAQAMLDVLVALQSRQHKTLTTIRFLQGVDGIQVPAESDLVSLRQWEGEIESLTGLRSRLLRTTQTVGRLVGIEQISTPSPDQFETLTQAQQELVALQKLRDQYQNSFARVQRIQGIEAVSVEIDTSLAEKVLSTIQVVVGLRDRFVAAHSGVVTLTQELATLESEETQLTEEILGVIGNLGQCPFCGSTVAQGDESCQQSSGSP